MGHRTELQREIAEALISTKAINFDAVGSIIAKYGARATINGDVLGFVINHRVFNGCIPPDVTQVITLPERVEQFAEAAE